MSEAKTNKWCSPDKCLSLLINNNALKGQLNAYRTASKSNYEARTEQREYYLRERAFFFDWKDTRCEKIMGARLANQLLTVGIERMGQFEILTKEQLVEKGIKKTSTHQMWMHTDKMKVRLGYNRIV